ncbi:hypothetical protein [Sporolactobacillus sp. THM19-2]|uniref:hypothetical protein n=1 Tax=Sporolactobacillus sp. THM19-2 TaxID=2511171 RepID=UPI00101ECA7B|nr:hypothetical protein [Sporolactobacillus sp. THM19-2]RYL92590.1 hypothetical protein EWH91_06930 [Sporolactobacillus sp. THM19-2]
MYCVEIMVSGKDCYIGENPSGVPVALIEESDHIVFFKDWSHDFALKMNDQQISELKEAKDCVVIDFDQEQVKCLYAFPDVAVAFVKKDVAS